MISVKKCHSILLLHSWLFTLGLDFLVQIDKVLAWLRFRKVYVLKASFSEKISANYWHKFPSNYKLKLSNRFWDANFPLNISPSERIFEKYKPQGFFLEFYGIFNINHDLGLKLQKGSCPNKKLELSGQHKPCPNLWLLPGEIFLVLAPQHIQVFFLFFFLDFPIWILQQQLIPSILDERVDSFWPKKLNTTSKLVWQFPAKIRKSHNIETKQLHPPKLTWFLI